jgi:pimeloyl-ACP methyl ester carboxylesterase
MTVSVKTVQLSDGTIEYLEAGSGEPIVFFHGGGGPEAKAGFIPELAQRYRVLAPARPGYNGSTGPGDTPREAAETMSAFIRAAVGGPVHLIAESAGGAPACWLAILHPDLLQSLILAAPAAFASHGPGPAREPAPSREGPPPAPPSPAEMERRLFGEHPAWAAPLTTEDLAQRQRNVQPNMARMRPPNGNADLLQRLDEISTPTLVLWGTADEVIPPEQSQIYDKRIPHVHRVYLYGAAHALPVSACDRFVRLATDFIDRGDAFVVNQR